MKKYYVIRTLWFDINCWLAWVNKANWHLTITELKINEQQSKAYFIHLKGKGSCDDKSSKRRETFSFPNNGFSMLERERACVCPKWQRSRRWRWRRRKKREMLTVNELSKINRKSLWLWTVIRCALNCLNRINVKRWWVLWLPVAVTHACTLYYLFVKCQFDLVKSTHGTWWNIRQSTSSFLRCRAISIEFINLSLSYVIFVSFEIAFSCGFNILFIYFDCSIFIQSIIILCRLNQFQYTVYSTRVYNSRSKWQSNSEWS